MPQPEQSIGEYLGHVAGALSVREHQSAASCVELAHELTFAEADALLAEHAAQQHPPAAVAAAEEPADAAPAGGKHKERRRA